MGNSAGLVRGHEEGRSSLNLEFPKERHEEVLRRGTDVPEQEPSFQISLSEVGVSNKTVWIRLPQGRFPFDAGLYVDLPANVRGIHMSRIEEAISLLYDQDFPDPGAYARTLAVKIKERQRGSSARVRLEGKMPLVHRTSVSGKESVDTAEVEVEVHVYHDGSGGMVTRESIGLGLCHITACPCTQLYVGTLVPGNADSLPLLTHSQRSLTWLRLGNPGGCLCIDDLYGCLSAALHTTQDLLKRPDEAELVIRAHRVPQFAEDSVREVARQVGLRLRGILGRAEPVLIRSLSLESIHIHDVRASIQTTMGEILDALDRE